METEIMKKIAILFEINCLAKNTCSLINCNDNDDCDDCKSIDLSIKLYYLKEKLIIELIHLIKNNITSFSVFTDHEKNIIYFEKDESFQSSYHFFNSDIMELEEEYDLTNENKGWIGYRNDINPFNPFFDVKNLLKEYLRRNLYE